MIEKLGGVNGLTDAFLATEMGMLGLLASAFGIQAALRLRAEETALRAEPLLATGVTRTRWAASHLVMAFGGTTRAGAARRPRCGDLIGRRARLHGSTRSAACSARPPWPNCPRSGWSPAWS